MKRVKKRYVAFSSEPKFSPIEIFRAVQASYRELFGLTGLASADLKLAKGYQEEGIAIIRCALKSVPRLFLAGAAVTKIRGERAAVRALTMSGTIKKVKKKINALKIGGLI